MFTIDLSTQTVLVTGAGRGIGRAIVDALLDAGAWVIAHYHRTPIDFDHPKLCTLSFNLNQIEEIPAFWNACLELQQQHRMPSIQGLVLNAAVALSAPLDMPYGQWLDAWQQTLRVNVTSAAALAKEVLASFRLQRKGRFVWIASRAAFRGDTPEYWAYAASKSAMLGVSRSIARFHGKEGICSFALAPGFTMTHMAQDFIDAYGEEYVKNDIALEHITQPRDVALWVPWLLSGHADHATGATIDVNAGSYIR